MADALTLRVRMSDALSLRVQNADGVACVVRSDLYADMRHPGAEYLASLRSERPERLLRPDDAPASGRRIFFLMWLREGRRKRHIVEPLDIGQLGGHTAGSCGIVYSGCMRCTPRVGIPDCR